MAGYSGTPLIKKLGIRPTMSVYLVGAPQEYASWLGELPEGASLLSCGDKDVEAAHIFSTRRAQLEHHLSRLRPQLRPDGFVWVSWPKKASKVPTDITEEVIREVALPLGFVDIKVCAVSDVWSGLKLVIRKTKRQAALRT